MSTGLECEFIEFEPGDWYYLLEDYDAPRNAFDWREYATAYGPFSSTEAANAHLGDHHANPGGASITTYDARYSSDEVLIARIAEAPENMRNLC
jgi:hypothetical protein